MDENRDHFTFFLSYREQIDLCDEKDQLRLYRAITDFALFHKDTTFTEPLLNMAWIGIKPHLAKSWTKHLNATKSKGIPKPGMKGNKNAVKDEDKSSEDIENKANSMQDQSENKTIGMERNVMNGTSSSVKDEDVDWQAFADTWKKNSWTSKPQSPLSNLQYGKVTDEQKDIVKLRIADCMKKYSVGLKEAKEMLYKVIKNAGNDTDKNNLKREDFMSAVTFAWLFKCSKNFFDVLDGNYLRK